ncbi:sodium:proton antiporter, partial [Bradyrhizobium oligotrophicum]
MTAAIVAVFALAYAAVALEHPLRINKAATALVGAGLMWTVYALLGGATAQVAGELNESVASTAQII